MQVVYQSEIDPYCVKMLAKRWPNVPNLGDVKKIEWENLDNVEVIAGGYPCQPFSTAGKRKGEEDPRHLWPYVFDAIRAIRPRYALMENVRGHLSLGFGTVLGDLASIGFDAEWQVLPASAFGAPHRRDRVFIVAYTNGEDESDVSVDAESVEMVADSDQFAGYGRRHRECAETFGERHTVQKSSNRGSSTMANAESGRDVRRIGCCRDDRKEVFEQRDNERGTTSDAFGQWWEVEPDVGRVANGVPARVDRLRGLGNAVVPQVAEFVGRRILAHAQIAV